MVNHLFRDSFLLVRPVFFKFSTKNVFFCIELEADYIAKIQNSTKLNLILKYWYWLKISPPPPKFPKNINPQRSKEESVRVISKIYLLKSFLYFLLQYFVSIIRNTFHRLLGLLHHNGPNEKFQPILKKSIHYKAKKYHRYCLYDLFMRWLFHSIRVCSIRVRFLFLLWEW